MLRTEVPMSFVIPRSPRPVEFLSDLPTPTPDETVTCVVRPGLKRLARDEKRSNARPPPKARTAAAEIALPSVIVADEPGPLHGHGHHVRRVSPRERVATVVMAKNPYLQKQALRPIEPQVKPVSARTAAAVTGAVAFVLTVVFLAFLPFLTSLFGFKG
jgi:hypothetical protein